MRWENHWKSWKPSKFNLIKSWFPHPWLEDHWPENPCSVYRPQHASNPINSKLTQPTFSHDGEGAKKVIFSPLKPFSWRHLQQWRRKTTISPSTRLPPRQFKTDPTDPTTTNLSLMPFLNQEFFLSAKCRFFVLSLKVQIFGILEEKHSFYWPKMHLWKGTKKKSSFFSGDLP